MEAPPKSKVPARQERPVPPKLTEKERRELLIADRQMALEGVREAVKWCIAAALTLNTGGAVAALNYKPPMTGMEGPTIALFALGALQAIVAALCAALVAWVAHVRFEVALGILPPFWKGGQKWGLWIALLLFLTAFSSSLWTFWNGLMTYEDMAALQYKQATDSLEATIKAATPLHPAPGRR
jgi:hypothetical protein